jgi:hypothetical protein
MPDLETTFFDVKGSLIFSILNAADRIYPFPHFYCSDVFPKFFYDKILKNLPDQDCFINNVDKGAVHVVNKEYLTTCNSRHHPCNSRSVIHLNSDEIFRIEKSKQPFWIEFKDVLKSSDFMVAFFRKFLKHLKACYGVELDSAQIYPKIDLIWDSEDYALGPHTDSPEKIAVLIIYLPNSDQNSHLGTSIYVPNEPNFVCNGGPHYDRNNFTRVFTAPFLPNSAFGFFKTNNSFHGVEPVKGVNELRNLIQISFKHNLSL